jgi:DUF971 family protein
LRSGCQCAECVDEHTGEKLLDRDEIDPLIKAHEISRLGHYAVAVNWSDGHNSGIYSYQYIRKISQPEESGPFPAFPSGSAPYKAPQG